MKRPVGASMAYTGDVGHVVIDERTRRRIRSLFAVLVGGVALGAVAMGSTKIGMAVGGGLTAWCALGAGSRVVQWFDRPHSDGAELWWDVLIIGIVLLGLAGLGLMALALPN